MEEPKMAFALRQQENIQEECQAHLSMAKHWLDHLLQPAKGRNEQNTLMPYNEILIHLDDAISKSSLFSHVHPSETLRKDAEACEQDANRFLTELSLNKEVYQALLAVSEQELDPLAKRFLRKTIQDFKRAGVDKDPKTRQRIKVLQDELVEIGQTFSRNIRQDTRFIELDSVDALSGLPADYILAHPASENGKIKITTDYPDYIPFMTYAESSDARHALWMQFTNRAYPQNESVLKQLLQKRDELAHLLGYPSYADYVVENKMIQTSKRALDFIEDVAHIAKESADRDYALLLKEKQVKEPGSTQIFGFERAYWEEIYKKHHLEIDSKEVRPYFEFSKVREGLLRVTSQLFGVRYEPVEDPNVWHPSVTVYDVYEGVTRIGRIYLDLHPRENKYKHAAQFTLRSGVQGRRLPEGVLVCNFADPSVHQPALMDHDQVVTLFHEFGHLMHHVLGGNQKWIRFSGVQTEWDFVEAPSQLLEEWAWQPEVLQQFAIHADTKKTIPSQLVTKMRKADEFGKGLDARQQMFYAIMSLEYHLKPTRSFEPTQLMKELQNRYSYFPYIEGTHMNCNFGHLEGYSAMYYTYMWSKAISKDLLTPFQEKGMMDLNLSGRYRDCVLKPGGSEDAAELVKCFLNRPYRLDAFKKWLMKS